MKRCYVDIIATRVYPSAVNNAANFYILSSHFNILTFQKPLNYYLNLDCKDSNCIIIFPLTCTKLWRKRKKFWNVWNSRKKKYVCILFCRLVSSCDLHYYMIKTHRRQSSTTCVYSINLNLTIHCKTLWHLLC